jgi:hypothetical protein
MNYPALKGEAVVFFSCISWLKVKPRIRGIGSTVYAKISRRNLQLPRTKGALLNTEKPRHWTTLFVFE